MQCAHQNLCTVPSRSYSSPGWMICLDPTKKHRYRRISYTDIEGAFIDIDKSLISGYNDIEVLNFDIDVSSISYCVDIEVSGVDIRVKDFSISYWFDIEGYNLQYRRFSELRHSTSKVYVVKSYPKSKVIFRPSISKVDIEGRQASR
jgi:hypothetical protein